MRTDDPARQEGVRVATRVPPAADPVGSPRMAVEGDLAAVENLLRAAGLPTDGVADLLPSHLLVAGPPGEVVGAAGVEPVSGTGLLRSVVVAPLVRGRGIGGRLCASALDLARTGGLSDLYLLTMGAERYFQGLGFSTIHRDDVPDAVRATREFSALCPASATVMHLSVGVRIPTR